MSLTRQTMTDEQRKSVRCFIYLDPDYAGQDTARYPWLAGVHEEATA